MEAIANPEEVMRWKQRHRRDFLDAIRAIRFLSFRYDEDGRELVARDEAAELTAAVFVGTEAATTKDVVLKLISKMRSNDEQEWGRYYLGAGSAALQQQIDKSRLEVHDAYKRWNKLLVARRGRSERVQGYRNRVMKKAGR